MSTATLERQTSTDGKTGKPGKPGKGGGRLILLLLIIAVCGGIYFVSTNPQLFRSSDGMDETPTFTRVNKAGSLSHFNTLKSAISKDIPFREYEEIRYIGTSLPGYEEFTDGTISTKGAFGKANNFSVEYASDSKDKCSPAAAFTLVSGKGIFERNIILSLKPGWYTIFRLEVSTREGLTPMVYELPCGNHDLILRVIPNITFRAYMVYYQMDETYSNFAKKQRDFVLKQLKDDWGFKPSANFSS